LKNKYFIYWKFTTKDTFNDLEKVFTWRCNKWKDTNNKTCLQLGINPYSDSALTIIDQDYNSPLFK
jgi:mannosyltransferase OCH1-like enzyme